MIVSEILRGLVLDKAADWDPVGLQLGDRDAEASSVGVCHEVTDRVVEEAQGLDLLITYHPLLFKPTRHLLSGSGPEGRAYRLIQSGVNVAVVHTAWDCAPGGAADALAERLGLANVSQFGLIEPGARKKLVTFVPSEAVERVLKGLTAAGAGTIGNYRGCSFRSEGTGAFLPESGTSPTIGQVGEIQHVAEVRVEMLVQPSRVGAVVASLLAMHPYEEPAFDLIDSISNAGFVGRIGDFPGKFEGLVAGLREKFGPEVRVAGRSSTGADRIAVLPGSGGAFVTEAAAAGAGVFVTGDLSHHLMTEAVDLGMAAIDIGHAASEMPGVRALLDLVGKMVPDVIDLSPHPTPLSS